MKLQFPSPEEVALYLDGSCLSFSNISRPNIRWDRAMVGRSAIGEVVMLDSEAPDAEIWFSSDQSVSLWCDGESDDI